MEEVSTRTVFVSVGVLVTVVLFSLSLASFQHIKQIYATVKETDTTIHGQFEESFAMYEGKTVSAMELVNIIKKYEDDPQAGIIIKYTNQASIINWTSNNAQMAEYKNASESERLKYCMKNKLKQFNYQIKYDCLVTKNAGNIELFFRKK